MVSKVTIVCLVAVLIQTIKAQCIGNPSLAGPGLALGNNYLANQGLSYGINPGALSNGGGLMVTSSSPIAPTGISVLAENLLIEGPVAVAGQLPLLATIALEGAVPAGGQAGASYGCGNGNVGILNEIGAGGIGGAGVGAAGIGAAGIGPAGLVPGLGLGAGLGGCGRLL